MRVLQTFSPPSESFPAPPEQPPTFSLGDFALPPPIATEPVGYELAQYYALLNCCIVLAFMHAAAMLAQFVYVCTRACVCVCMCVCVCV